MDELLMELKAVVFEFSKLKSITNSLHQTLTLENGFFLYLTSKWMEGLITLVVFPVLWMVYFYLWLPINMVSDVSDVGFGHLFKKSHTLQERQRLVGEVQRKRELGDRPFPYPNGWFALLESTDLKVGQVKHVKALGENFAVMRSADGEVHVLDAYCPHLGANMAEGGVVKGDCLECPFHGWQFRGEDGQCVHIPYSDKVPKSAAVKKWTSCEMNDCIFVWYHVDGAAPSWQIERVPQIDSGEWWNAGRFEYVTYNHIQDNNENVADVAHFDLVHGAGVPAGGDNWNTSILWNYGFRHSWRVHWEPHEGEGEGHISTSTVRQVVLILNRVRILPAGVVLRLLGPAIIHLQYGSVFTLSLTTPLDSLRLKVIHRVYSKPLLSLYARCILLTEFIMIKRDMKMWNHKKFQSKPLLVKEDHFIMQYRRWYSQFYSYNNRQANNKQNELLS